MGGREEEVGTGARKTRKKGRRRREQLKKERKTTKFQLKAFLQFAIPADNENAVQVLNLGFCSDVLMLVAAKDIVTFRDGASVAEKVAQLLGIYDTLLETNHILKTLLLGWMYIAESAGLFSIPDDGESLTYSSDSTISSNGSQMATFDHDIGEVTRFGRVIALLEVATFEERLEAMNFPWETAPGPWKKRTNL